MSDTSPQVRAAKGPIFEDGPNFEMAFRLFHGRDGVVPLSGRSFVHSEKVEPELPSPQFNPLAAKAATISLSSFGPGGPFSFDSFSEMWKNQKRKDESSKRESSSKVSPLCSVHFLVTITQFFSLFSVFLGVHNLIVFFSCLFIDP